MWATCNIGAEDPKDKGLLFAWGETQGYKSISEHNFNWNNYKFSINGSSSNFSKYNSTDNKIILDLEDDAANVILGGKWRTPSESEFDELLQACSFETVNGMTRAYLKTNRNIEIYFPLSCYHMVNNLREVNAYDYYCRLISNGRGFISQNGRCNQASIRPVLPLS